MVIDTRTKNERLIDLLKLFLNLSDQILYEGEEETIYPAIEECIGSMRSDAQETIRFMK